MPKQQPLCGGICGPAPKYLWIYSTIILLFYGFFKELKPSESFLTPYLTNATDGKNFSLSEVNQDIYPYWTYSYLVAALFVFLFTDLMRYNPIILIEAIFYLITRVLLIWGNTLDSMKLMQVVYGVATATEVGYYSFIYPAVPFKYHVLLTGPVRAAVLFGRSISSFLGQGLFSSGVLNYYGLNYFSLVSVIIACIFAFMLPWYFTPPCGPNKNNHVTIQGEDGEGIVPPNSCIDWFKDTVTNQVVTFKRFYFRPSLLKWSLWWAFAMCGVLQVGNYVQSLWKAILIDNDDYSNDHEWNGVVEGVTDLVSAGSAILASLLKVNWSSWGELTIGIFSLIQSILLIISSHTRIIWVAYGNHVIYRASFAFMITIVSSQLAIQLNSESYGLIFGFNYFIALVLQTILTVIVDTGLNLDTRTQFVVYGCYYFFLTAIYMFAGAYKLGYNGCISSIRTCFQRQQLPRHESIHETVNMYVSEDSTSSESSLDESEETREDVLKYENGHSLPRFV